MDNYEIGVPVGAVAHYKKQLLNFAGRFSSCCFLDNNQYRLPLHAQECLVAWGQRDSFTWHPRSQMKDLDEFLQRNRGQWVFGHISYDMQEPIWGISSPHPNPIGFATLHFFVPEGVARLSEDKLLFTLVSEAHMQQIKDELQQPFTPNSSQQIKIALKPRMTRHQYIDTINQLRQHIRRGDCYEINYCVEFFATYLGLQPIELYRQLIELSPNPFACYYRHHESHLLCASPERFLMKQGDRLFSQPIKGTAPRFLNDAHADQQAMQQLRQSAKEQSENVMVVDLVRNDLSQVCIEGSVQVDELFGIYSYPQVHQMTSTISGHLKPGITFSQLLRALFPMGSMTGAPKRRVLQLIARYEASRRGLFSGSTGYIAPDGNFDFNVVIRSLLYHAGTGYLSYQVGSGITWYSRAENEFEECMLKAAAIEKLLGN